MQGTWHVDADDASCVLLQQKEPQHFKEPAAYWASVPAWRQALVWRRTTMTAVQAFWCVLVNVVFLLCDVQQLLQKQGACNFSHSICHP